MASSDARDAELARLSGSELVERLRTTCRLADYEAVARVLDARDRRLAKAEAALAEAKKGLDTRDVRLAKAEAAIAEAKEGLDARDVRLAKAEAALAEAKEGLNARDRRLAKVQAALDEAKAVLDARDCRFLRIQEDLATALAALGALREKYDALKDASRGPASEGARGEPRSENARRGPRDEAARPGDAIAALSPASVGERRAVVAGEKVPAFIDLCNSDDGEEEREGSRGKVSGVSRKRKAAASVVKEEGRRASVSWKRNAAASDCSSDDEDDTLTLSQLMLKRRDGAQPGADGEPKNADSVQPLGRYLPEVSLVVKEEAIEATVGGSDEPNVATLVQERGNVKSGEDVGMSRTMLSPQSFNSAMGNSSEKNFSKFRVGVRTAWTEGSLGNDLRKTPVVTERPEIRVVGYDFVHGRGNGKSAGNGVSRAPPPGFAARTGSLPPGFADRTGSLPPRFAARTGSPPPGFAARTGSQKKLSRADHGGPRIAGKDDSFAGQEEDTLAQLSNSSLSARKIAESARTGTVSPKGHTCSALGGNMILGSKAIREQEKKNSGGHNVKVFAGTTTIEEQVPCGMVAGAIREQGETKGLVLKRNAMPLTNGIGKKRGKLNSSQSRGTNDGGQPRTSDKQPGSATTLSRDELHSGPASTSVEGSLPSAVTRNWKCETDMFTSCFKNKDLCMQAACALYRQKKLVFQPTEGGRSVSSGLCKSDAHRVAKLMEFLLDGDVQGPLKRTAEELVKHDSTGPSFLEKVVCRFHDQLFYIYKNKEDPYFC